MLKSKRNRNSDKPVVDERKKLARTKKREDNSQKATRKSTFDSQQKNQVDQRAKKQNKPSRLPVFANKFGWTQIEITSLNAYKILPKLSENFLVKVIESDEVSCIVSVKSKHLSQVIAILNKLCYDYKIIKTTGVLPTVFRTMSRFGVGVGFVVTVVAFVISSAYITRVSVDGVRDPALRAQIVALLEDNGVKRGGKASYVDEKVLSDKILAMDGVAFTSVKRNGGRISVFVKEELPPAEFVEIAGQSVTAKMRAVVTRVIVDGGTAVVKYGDVVSVGDVLIAGYTEYGEEQIPVVPYGEVFGKVYHQKKLYFANTTLKKTYGDTKTVTRLSFFGRVPKTPGCDFENYELEVTKKKNEFFLPYTAYTFKFVEITSNEEENAKSLDEMKKQAYSAVLEDIDTAVKVLSVYFDVTDTETGRYIAVTVETEEKIS